MYCDKCGNAVLEQAKYCGTCGSELYKSATSGGGEPATSQRGDSKSSFITAEGKAWRRLCARYIDFFLVTAFFYMVLLLTLHTIFPEMKEAFYEETTASYTIIDYAIFLFFSVLVESLFLWVLGTTPGKLLLNIEIENKHQNKDLSLLKVIRRSWLVLVYGAGGWVPILSLGTIYFSYGKLKTTGITHWDEIEDTCVTFGEMGALRMIVSGIVLITTSTVFFFWLTAFLIGAVGYFGWLAGY